MQKWIRLATALPLIMFSLAAQSADWHCITTTTQTSVDFVGEVFHSTCIPANVDAAKEAEERKNCERGSRKNKAKEWLPGACPTKRLISTCTITKMGPATLPQPKIVHTYEEQGGNLSRADEVNLAREQCSRMSLNSGKFVEVAPESSSVVKTDKSNTGNDSVKESAPEQAQDQNKKEDGAVKKGVESAKEKLGKFKDLIY